MTMLERRSLQLPQQLMKQMISMMKRSVEHKLRQ